MYESAVNHQDDAEIARHEVSEDGVNWRPYDAARDEDGRPLHRRIHFAPVNENVGPAR